MVGDAARIKQTLYHIVSGALKNITGDNIALEAQRTAGGDVTFIVRHRAGEAYGPGLGVYLAQRMVELHGGRLDITTDNGETIVACRLPAGGAAAGRAGPISAGPVAAGH